MYSHRRPTCSNCSGGERRAGIFSAASLALLALANVQWAVVLFAGLAGLAALQQLNPAVGRLFLATVLGSLPLCLIAIAKPRYAFPFEPVLLISALVFASSPRALSSALPRRDRAPRRRVRGVRRVGMGGVGHLRDHVSGGPRLGVMSQAKQAYRPDIDGLRGVAIAPVVAFHAFPQLIPGGFVGVDVFFVISGYLISTIILEGLDDRTFTLAGFYARRIRRIFPALALVLLAGLLWGWIGLFASDYAQLGKHTAAGAGFAANLVLWSEAGYFDGASEMKPLLHLWSLGIEEQFYLLWPTALIAMWAARRRPSAIAALVAVVFAASFLYNAVLVRTDEVAAFYSPATRFWELLLGAAFAFVSLGRRRPSFTSAWTDLFWRWYSPVIREIGAWLGLVAILTAFWLFNRDTSFPGWRAGLPAGGTLLLIAAGPDAWLNRRVLSLPAIVGLGLISYPLYLWHWPLLSFAQIGWGVPSPAIRLAIVGASVLLAWLTYLFVERPVRFVWRSATPVVALCLLMLIAGATGYVAFARDGFYDRSINRSDQAHFLQYYERLHKRGLSAAYRAECDFMDWATEATRPAIESGCTQRGTRATVFLWGDSHAQALSHGISAVLPGDTRLAQVATSGCAPRLREPDPEALHGRCRIANSYALDRIADLKPDVVVLAQILAHEATDWIEVAEALRMRGAKRVVLVGPAPEWQPSLPAVIVNQYWGQNHERVASTLFPQIFATDRVLREKYEHVPALDYVSLISALCDERGCMAVVPGPDKQLMVVDNGHFSPAGSVYVAETILRPHLVVE